MRFLIALLALGYALANGYVGYLFVTTALTEKMAHKGFVLQSLPLLGGIALVLFCLPVLWQAIKLLITRPATV